MKALTSTIFILLVSSAYVFAQDSIGFSFNSDRDNTPMDETTVAGIVPSPGWVSTDGGADAQGGATCARAHRCRQLLGLRRREALPGLPRR